MIDQKKLFNQVINLLSYRDRSEWEIRQYLKKKLKIKKNTPDPIIDQIVKKLYHFNLLNDQKFVSQWIKAKTQSKFYGPKRLFVDLIKKGINKKIINHYLNKISPESWVQIASQLLSKKSKKLNKLENKRQRQKAFQLLASRGFSYDIIKSAIDSYFAKE